ncbi:MAG: DUF4406 domain-containing protein [Bacteroidota bacterium]
MKTYFARPIHLYKTAQDSRDLETLKALGLAIVNPDKEALQAAYQKEGMSVFLQAIEDCDALAYRSFPDLKISAGVAKEIAKAKELGLPVIELPTLTQSRVLSVDDTRAYLHFIGQR